MPGRAIAVRNGDELKATVVKLGQTLGLETRTEVRVGRRLWGAQRCIDVVLTRRDTGKALGIEASFKA
jgi:hypothetical protein